MPRGKFWVSLTHLAKTDFEDILIYTERQWGSRQSDLYAAMLDQALNSLSVDADRNHSLEGTEYFFVRVGKHRVFYRIQGLNVEVVRILHGRMDFRSHLD